MSSTFKSVGELQLGWGLLLSQGAIVAELPIEEWLRGLERADSVAPFLDPTAYRTYLHSGKGELLKEVFAAALVFKRAIQKAQQQVEEDARLQRVYSRTGEVLG